MHQCTCCQESTRPEKQNHEYGPPNVEADTGTTANAGEYARSQWHGLAGVQEVRCHSTFRGLIHPQMRCATAHSTL